MPTRYQVQTRISCISYIPIYSYRRPTWPSCSILLLLLLFGVVIVGPSIASRLSWAFSPPSMYNIIIIIIIHTARSWMTILLTFHTYNTYLPNGAAVPRSALRYMYIICFWLINRPPTYHNNICRIDKTYIRCNHIIIVHNTMAFETVRCAGLLQRVRVLLYYCYFVWWIQCIYIVYTYDKKGIGVWGKKSPDKNWDVCVCNVRRLPVYTGRNDDETQAAIQQTLPRRVRSRSSPTGYDLYVAYNNNNNNV